MRSTDHLDNILPDLVALRHDIHRHPELGYEVQRTAARVAEELRAAGCDEVIEGIGQTGLVGVIRGRRRDSGVVIGLRADMDALPIREASGKSWASGVDGRMHACGHDGHTTMLLGAARLLAGTREFDGTAVLIFQPAEENGAGGKAMVDDGLMERFGIQEVYGLHNMPGLPVGAFATRKGAFLASTDDFRVTVHGVGGHAAMPHVCRDPVVASAHVILGVQGIVSRFIRPVEPLVISITMIDANNRASNVIPPSVTLGGTVRCFDAVTRQSVLNEFERVVSQAVSLNGCTATIDIDSGYPPTVNHDEQVDIALRAAQHVSECEQIDGHRDPVMGAEDFAYMLEARPGAFMMIGNGDTANLHHPAYDFNDEAIRYGCHYWKYLVETRMPLDAG